MQNKQTLLTQRNLWMWGYHIRKGFGDDYDFIVEDRFKLKVLEAGQMINEDCKCDVVVFCVQVGAKTKRVYFAKESLERMIDLMRRGEITEDEGIKIYGKKPEDVFGKPSRSKLN